MRVCVCGSKKLFTSTHGKGAICPLGAISLLLYLMQLEQIYDTDWMISTIIISSTVVELLTHFSCQYLRLVASVRLVEFFSSGRSRVVLQFLMFTPKHLTVNGKNGLKF